MQKFENRLTFDKVTESLKVGSFFETQCRNSFLSAAIICPLIVIQQLVHVNSPLQCPIHDD